MLATSAPPSLRPPLKWAGGKRWQVPHLRPLWEGRFRSRLVEPFCGGLAVTLGLVPERALLNDANPHLINFYRWLQKGLTADLKMENNERLFYRHRARFNELVADGQEDTAEGAALFYYLNRTGFNGLCRFNSKGEFNVPFGKYARIGYTHDFTQYKESTIRRRIAERLVEARSGQTRPRRPLRQPGRPAVTTRRRFSTVPPSSSPSGEGAAAAVAKLAMRAGQRTLTSPSTLGRELLPPQSPHPRRKHE